MKHHIKCVISRHVNGAVYKRSHNTQFIDGLKREQSLQELRIEQYVGGVSAAEGREKYRDCAMRLKNIVSDYDTTNNVEEYLRSI